MTERPDLERIKERIDTDMTVGHPDGFAFPFLKNCYVVIDQLAEYALSLEQELRSKS